VCVCADRGGLREASACTCASTHTGLPGHTARRVRACRCCGKRVTPHSAIVDALPLLLGGAALTSAVVASERVVALSVDVAVLDVSRRRYVV
jgi:hypothetical protein